MICDKKLKKKKLSYKAGLDFETTQSIYDEYKRKSIPYS